LTALNSTVWLIRTLDISNIEGKSNTSVHQCWKKINVKTAI